MRSLRNRKITIVWEKGGMFPGKSKISHIEGFIEEPIKLSVRKLDGMLLTQIAGLT